MSISFAGNRRRIHTTNALLAAASLFALLGVSSLHAAQTPGASNLSSTCGVIVLDSGDTSGALTITGTARASAQAFYVNSSSKSAVSGSGRAVIDTPAMNVVGGAAFNGSAVCTSTITTFPAPVLDPFADLVAPAADAAHDKGALALKEGTVTVDPGYYSGGISIRGNANVTFNPGVYILGDGLSINGGTISGEGVTFVIQRGRVSMAGNANETLSPPTTGPWAGVVIAQPAANTGAMSIAGGNTMVIAGAIWAPTAAVTITGNASATDVGPIMGDSLIVKTLTINGTGQLRVGRPSSVVAPPQVTNLND